MLSCRVVLFIANDQVYVAVIDGEGYGSIVGQQGGGVTAMDTSSAGGGIMRGGIYHPSAAPCGGTDPQVRCKTSYQVIKSPIYSDKG